MRELGHSQVINGVNLEEDATVVPIDAVKKNFSHNAFWTAILVLIFAIQIIKEDVSVFMQWADNKNL